MAKRIGRLESSFLAAFVSLGQSFDDWKVKENGGGVVRWTFNNWTAC